MVWLEVTHSALQIRTEKQFDPNLSVEGLKERLYPIVGTSPSYMKLQLYDTEGNMLSSDLNDQMTLGQCGVTVDRMRIHVVDMDPTNAIAQLNNLDAVEKYTISEEDYDRRDDTFRKWKGRNIVSSTANDEQKQQKEATQEQTLKLHEELIKNIKVGDRCQLINEVQSRGEVKYVGKAAFGSGYWVGIKLDEPVGKHNGTVKGMKYFECPDKHGVFVKPDKVNVGDFPEEDFDFGSDDEI